MAIDSELLKKKDTNKFRKLWIENVFFGLGHVYNDLCASVWFSYALFYFQIVMQMPSTTAGLLIMLGQITDAISTPVSGWIIDKIHNKTALHATGSILVTIGFTFTFSIRKQKSYVLNTFMCSVLIILFQIGWALVQISHLSIIPYLAEDNSRSNVLTTIRYTASVCCGIIVYMTTWIVLKDETNSSTIGPEDFFKFRKIIFIITTVGILSTIIFYMGLQKKLKKLNEYQLLPKVKVEDTGEEKEIFPKNFLKSWKTYKVSLLYMTSRLYTILNLIYIPLYLDERKTNEISMIDGVRSTVATVPLVVYLTSFFTSLSLNFRKGGDLIIYFIGSIFCLSASVWIGVLGGTTTNAEIYGIAILIGIGGSTTLVTSLCLTANHVKNNGFKSGSVYGIVTFTDKLASGLVVFTIQYLQTSVVENLPDYYSYVLAYVCGGTAFLGLLSLATLSFFHPTSIDR